MIDIDLELATVKVRQNIATKVTWQSIAEKAIAKTTYRN